MAEYTARLACKNGHEHDVYWDEEQKAEVWICPTEGCGEQTPLEADGTLVGSAS